VGFFSGTSVSSTNKTDRHHIAEILLKVVLNTITLTPLKEKGGGGLLDYSFVLYSCDNRELDFFCTSAFVSLHLRQRR
jgi:hypothetical protein